MKASLLLALLLATGTSVAAASIRDAAGSGLVLEHGTPSQQRGGETRHALRVDRRDIERVVAAGRPLLLPSIDGSPVPAVDVRIRRRADGIAIVTGRVATVAGPQTFVLTLGEAAGADGGAVFAHVPQRDGTSLRVETKQGRTWLVEGGAAARGDTLLAGGIDFLRVPAPTAAGRALRRQQDTLKAADASTAAGPNVDVVVLYTPTLVSIWGSDAAMKARIAHLEALANQAYVDSDVSQSVTVVGAYMVDYVSIADNIDALETMTSSTASTLANLARQMRNVHGADLVALVREFDRANQTSCGVGWLGGYEGAPFTAEWGFSVSADHGFGEDHCGDYTFAHELGHNMGAHHDIETTDGEHGAYPYSRGFRRTLTVDSGFATVMAYSVAPQARIGRFSNPRQSFCLGQPCGDAATADNARGLTQAAPSIAAFGTRPTTSLPEMRIADVIVVEGDSGTRRARLDVTLSSPSATQVSVRYETVNGTALRAYDYTRATGTLLIAAGQTTATINVDVRGETVVERDEYFSVNLSDAAGARLVDAQGIVTIDNDEPIPSFSLADAEVVEGDSGTTSLVFTASLSAPSTQPVTFNADVSEYSVAGAAAPGDYTPPVWRGLVIPAGETSVQFSLDVIGDTLPEPDERLRVVASKLQGAEITRDWARGWIRDDDAAVPGRIVLGSAVKPEGDAGDATLSVPVTLDTVTSIPVTFRLVAAGGSAAAGSDYSLDEAAVHTIAAGTTGTSVDIAVHGDTVAEGDETILLALADVTGAYHDATPVASTLLDDDGAAPVLQTRPDRFESGESLSMSVLDNDALSEARVARGTLQVTHVGDGGDAQVEMYDPAQPRSWVIHYTSARGFAGTTTVGYRVCEGAPPGRCADGVATIEVGMSPLWLTTVDGTGFFDTEPAIYQHDDGSPRFIGDYASTPLAAPETLERDHGVDPTPLSPWDGAREGTQVSLHVLPSPAGEPRDWKVFVEAAGVAGTEPDIYLGVDTDQGQDAEPSELLCTAAMNSFIESCGLDLTHPGTGVTRYWVLVHNRGAAGRVQTRIYEVPMIGGDGTLTATGPGLPRFGGFERFRGAWRDLTMFPGGTPRVGFVGVRLVEGGDLVWQRWRIEPDAAWTGRAAVALRHGVTTTVALEPGGAHDRMFVDVPQGATALTVTTTSAQDVDLYLARASSPSAPRIDPAPPRDAADASARTTSGNEILMRSGDALPPGRWYVTPVNVAAVPAVVDVRVELAAAATPPRRGSYFDPDRGGHGLFLYPAGSQWAGLWYAYFEDGSPTWYYLQAGAPGPDGIWTAPIYRARWDGDSHAQTAVGFATVTPTGADAFRFTWTLDGRTGSEPMIALGRGCPTDGGQPVDASSHWFNLATAGSGHSVQFWEDYEFYAAFVYDEAGVPRFLTAESNTYLGADATLPIDQLQGFCPLCDRTGAPSRYPVGTLRRTISGGTLTHLGISADFTGGQSGSWERYEPVQPLGGPGTTQGCAP